LRRITTRHSRRGDDQRGLMLAARALPVRAFRGQIIAEILPYDRVADTSRGHSRGSTTSSSSHGSRLFQLQPVSDSTYFADFSDRIAVTSQKTLPQEAGLNANYGRSARRWWCSPSRRCRTPQHP
jgi:hypothetical protein